MFGVDRQLLEARLAGVRDARQGAKTRDFPDTDADEQTSLSCLKDNGKSPIQEEAVRIEPDFHILRKLRLDFRPHYPRHTSPGVATYLWHSIRYRNSSSQCPA